MTRPVALAVALLLSLAAFADTRTMDKGDTRPGTGATVGGIVTAVNGTLIQLAGGSITIDAANAQIHGASTVIEPGMILFASLSTADVAPNTPLPAASISVTRLPDATLFGPVQAVDPSSNTITLLGRTIRVTADTSFGGFRKTRDGDRPGLEDILPNHLVTVTVDSTGGQLVATSVLLLAPAPPEVHSTRGEVKSIGADAWVIARERGDDMTVAVNAQTKIVGSPKVGDTVELLYRVDSANANVAISIIRFELPNPPFVRTFRVTGKVSSIAANKWEIAQSDGDNKVSLKITGDSKIEPGIVVGDSVEALAVKHDDGSATALLIVKKRF
jgi:Domain of unknown function (DUF5666)